MAKVLAAVVAIFVVSSGSVGVIAAMDVAGSAKHTFHIIGSDGHTQQAPSIGAISGGVNLLLLGSDSRTGQGGAFSSKTEQAASSGAGNNDVTILVHVAADHKSVSVVSFPRDLILRVPACPNPNGGTYPASSAEMLNATLTKGPSCTVLTIQQLTGLTSIPYVAVISFDGVTAMSDAVGGVTVCLASPVRDNYTNPPLNLPAGDVTLVGDQALSFLRSRHGVADASDLGRISNQQVFMSALARKVTSAGVLANPLQLYPLAKAAAQNVQLSDSLSTSTLVQIALAIKGVGLDNMVFVQYPTLTDPASPSHVIADQSAAPAVNAALTQDRPIQLSGTTGRGAVAPTATPSATSTPGTSSGGATSTASPSSSASVLPPAVTGQTAAEQTCTKGSS